MFSTKLDISTAAQGIDRQTALSLTGLSGTELFDLFALSNKLREKNHGSRVDLCSIFSAKSGACPEDCSFCSQSARSKTDITTHSLLDKTEVLRAAGVVKDLGVRRFCVVTSGKKATDKEIDDIAEIIVEIKSLGLLPCSTLGLVSEEQLLRLKDAGLHRYHHNLETSESFFSEICTTHTYRDKLKTIRAAKKLDLSVCSGGIFGLGESWDDRIDLAFALRDLAVDSVPINFLTPINGTPLGNRQTLSPMEALTIIAIFRLIMPAQQIRVCGGRPNTLRDMQSWMFTAGANGLLVGNYLTTKGRQPEADHKMIKDCGLTI